MSVASSHLRGNVLKDFRVVVFPKERILESIKDFRFTKLYLYLKNSLIIHEENTKEMNV